MLIAMRAISLGFQLDDKSISSLPDPLAYFGYLFHVGTVANTGSLIKITPIWKTTGNRYKFSFPSVSEIFN